MNFKLWIESSLNDLYNSAVQAFPRATHRQHSTDTIRIVELSWLPYLGLKTLFVKGMAQNEGRNYTPIILFKQVNFGRGIPLVASDGNEYLVERLSLEDNDVLVRCNCPDFRWRFRYYDHVDKALYGATGKKYQSHGGPPANPDELPGMCKHLMKMTAALKDSGILI